MSSNHPCRKRMQSASDTGTTFVEDDDEDIVDYNIVREDIIQSAKIISTWVHYRQDEIISDTPSGLAILLCSPDNIRPDQVTMDKIYTYLEEYVHESEFQDTEFDPDAIKSNSEMQSFLEHSAWDQRVTNKHAYSDNDHGRGIKAPSSLESSSLLQIIQFLVKCRQKLSCTGCEDKVVKLIQSFQAGKNGYSLACIAVDLASAFYKISHDELIWELNKFLPYSLRFLQEDITPTVDENLVQDSNGMMVNINENSINETMTVMWHQGLVAKNLKKEIKKRTRIGVIEGMPKAMPAIIRDLEDWEFWVQFGNGSVKAMTENLDFINIYEDCRDDFPSLELFFACIDSLHNNNGKYAAATVWLQKPEKQGEVVVRNHRDRKSWAEAMKEKSYGQDHKRYRMVIQLSPTNGPHRNRQKLTRFGAATGGGVNGVSVFEVNSIPHGFIMMHSVVNGKDPIVELGGESNINNNQYLYHSVIAGSHSVSLMCEFTLSDDITLDEAAEKISQCFGFYEQMKSYYDFQLPEPESLNNSDEGKVVKLFQRSKDLTHKHLQSLQEYIAEHGGKFPRHYDIDPDMSDEQRKETQLYHFWNNRRQWERHCEEGYLVELTKKFEEDGRGTYVSTADSMKRLQEYIAEHGGKFPRHHDIDPDMSDEQRKEQKLYAFWNRRDTWKHLCEEGDLVELTKKFEEDGRGTYVSTAVNIKRLREYIAEHGGKFPKQNITHSDMSDEQRKENKLYEFWKNRRQWEHLCEEGDLVELKKPKKPKYLRSPAKCYDAFARPSVKKDNPGAKYKDISLIITNQWKSMNKEERNIHTIAAATDNERFCREMTLYETEMEVYNTKKIDGNEMYDNNNSKSQ